MYVIFHWIPQALRNIIFFKGDYVAMREALGSMDRTFNMDCSTDTIWENFVNILNANIEKYVPKRSHTYSYKKPWMNRETAEIIDKDGENGFN